MAYESHHRIHHVGWLRAAVLGANDGIVSTASLVVGVAAAAVDRSAVLLAGVAGLVAGAMSMAAGEYVSVSSQADTEKADLERERDTLRREAEALRERVADFERAESAATGKQGPDRAERDRLEARVAELVGAADATAARQLVAGRPAPLPGPGVARVPIDR